MLKLCKREIRHERIVNFPENHARKLKILACISRGTFSKSEKQMRAYTARTNYTSTVCRITIIEKYNKYVKFHRECSSLEGRKKKKYESDFRYELDQYREACQEMKRLFPNGNAPKLKDLHDELETVKQQYADLSAERKAIKKEADRLSRLAQQKRDSQKTINRYLQNEQAAKRKKGQLE